MLIEFVVRKNLGDVVEAAESIVDVGCAEWHVRGEPGVGVVDRRRDDPEEEREAEEDVQGGPVRTEKRVRVVCNHGPVKSQREETHASDHTENLVDGQVVWRNPANPGKVAKAREDETWEPVPDESASTHDHEELDAGDSPTVGNGVGSRVQRAEEGDIAEHARPNHTGGLDEPRHSETCDGVSAKLATQDNEHGESWRDVEAIQPGCLNDVRRIS